MRAPYITQHWHADTGTLTFTVDEWPDMIDIQTEVLDAACPDVVSVDGDSVTFTVSNGTATYRIEGGGPFIRGWLISSRLSEVAAGESGRGP